MVSSGLGEPACGLSRLHGSRHHSAGAGGSHGLAQASVGSPRTAALSPPCRGPTDPSSGQADTGVCPPSAGAGVFFLSSAEGEQISFLFDCIVRGISPTKGPFGLRPVLPGGCRSWGARPGGRVRWAA